MTATLQDIEGWLKQAKSKGATHLIVAVDKYNYENYPVYVGPDENVQAEIQRVNSGSLQGIDEVYNMSMSIDEQLLERRVWNV